MSMRMGLISCTVCGFEGTLPCKPSDQLEEDKGGWSFSNLRITTCTSAMSHGALKEIDENPSAKGKKGKGRGRGQQVSACQFFLMCATLELLIKLGVAYSCEILNRSCFSHGFEKPGVRGRSKARSCPERELPISGRG